MSVFNLGVVFGPTLLRPLEETVAAILDIKFNNIVINILIENYELIFKNDPSSALLMSAQNSSPPMRVPRASQMGKPSSAGSGRNPLYSPQQQVYRVVAKSNYTDPPMSSSLQNIPNGLVYGGGGGTNGTNGGGLMPGHATNGGGSGPKSLGVTSAVNMGSVKNLHSMSQSDISVRRGGAAEPTYGMGGQNILTSTNGGGGGLTAHHATPATATNLRHDYLMATATPASTTVGSGSTNHIYSSPAASSGGRLNISNVSPPTLAMRTEAIYGTAAQQQHARNQLSYAQAKHYSPAAAASTSSSNESVCDSLSSNNGGGRLLTGRGSLDYLSASQPPHSSQASSLSTLLGSTCDDVVTATAAPSMIGAGDISRATNEGGVVDYAPKKVHRNKDVNQIKRDLSAGTA